MAIFWPVWGLYWELYTGSCTEIRRRRAFLWRGQRGHGGKLPLAHGPGCRRKSSVTAQRTYALRAPRGGPRRTPCAGGDISGPAKGCWCTCAPATPRPRAAVAAGASLAPSQPPVCVVGAADGAAGRTSVSPPIQHGTSRCTHPRRWRLARVSLSMCSPTRALSAAVWP
jgi:hypothetical protein